MLKFDANKPTNTQGKNNISPSGRAGGWAGGRADGRTDTQTDRQTHRQTKNNISRIIRSRGIKRFSFVNVASRLVTHDQVFWHILTKFYQNRMIKDASRGFQRFNLVELQYVKTDILTRTNAPPPGGHVFQATGTIFELVRDIIGINLLTKFHDDWTINVASS
ncbi:hypothetical protein DPMN_086732 [Dreissena polymorpha]|uniref:Uncharacterized protein n=1 Tax=Dreissena polymorpha TaxID=45954 RepID=A0A9D4KRZ0_DREPO|nr:hypothetical protein DPMN_086732 [Dreissena polymorpha]